LKAHLKLIDTGIIELSFEDVPSQRVRKKLGRNGLGFKWDHRNRSWYAPETPERLAYAKQLAGITEEKISSNSAPSEKYRYYSTQRPIDLGTYPEAGGALIGFQNFDTREEVEEGNFKAWGWLDYSRPLTEKEISDYELRPAPETVQLLNRKTAPDKHTESEKPKGHKPNTFAEHYDRIGDIPILKSANIGFFDFRNAAYFEDLNIYVHRTGCGDCLSILLLENAGKSGKTCDEWKFTLPRWSPGDDVCIMLNNDYGLHTIKDVWTDCLESEKSRDNFREASDDIRLNSYQHKAVNVFSPFIEVKPIKAVPKTWTKRSFTQALMSGQIYAGEISKHLTDDYALDASRNFCTGTRLNMPHCAREVVEGWDKLDSVRTQGEPDENEVYTLQYHDGVSTSSTMWFDPNCDIAEGKRREEGRAAGIKQYNEMMKASCLEIDPKAIDPNSIYAIQSLNLNENTGIYEAFPEKVQGLALIEEIEDHNSANILSLEEVDIIHDHIYQVISRDHTGSPTLKDDSRLCLIGNSIGLVTGKALLEMTEEGIYLPTIETPVSEYSTAEKAISTLKSFRDGSPGWKVDNTIASSYDKALNTLKAEVDRARSEPTLSSIDSLITAAQSKSYDLNNEKANTSKENVIQSRS